jgi:AcrR family transcriptional regulator
LPVRRKRLTQADVVRAAAAVAERGIADLTMAAVAAELGVTAMALYQHVDDKAHLLALLNDSLLEQVEVPLPSFGRWDVRLRAHHLAVTDAMSRYPGLVLVASHDVHAAGPAKTNIARLLEGYLQILLDAGFDVRTAGIAYTGLYYLAIGAQHPFEGRVASPASIPPTGRNWPALSKTASAMVGLTNREIQVAALDVYLDGLRKLRRARGSLPQGDERRVTPRAVAARPR